MSASRPNLAWSLGPGPHCTLEVMGNEENGWFTLVVLDDEHPEVTAVLAGRPVSVDLRQILRA